MEQRLVTPRANEPSFAVKAGKCVVKALDAIVNFAILAIFLLLLVYGSYALWQSNQIYRAADAKEFAMYRPTAEDEGLSFAALQQINPDVFAWLTVYGTNIDYPVTQTDDNETYVNTNVMGEYAISGNLFLDYTNAADFSDFNSIIYGHHMERNAMFGNIDQFIDPEYLESHLYGNLYFNGKDHGLELFAFLEADAYDYSIYQPAITAGHEERYIANLLSKSSHSRKIDIGPQDHIVLLSTCTDSTNGRHILVGKITSTTYPDTFQTEEERKDAVYKGIDALSIASILGSSKMAFAPPCILIILIVLYILCERGRKRKYDKKPEEEL